MDALKNVIYEKKDGIAKITINRPEARNALNTQTRTELKQVLDDVAADNEVRVVIITGAGEGAFCAGADLRELQDKTPLQARKHVGSFSRVVIDTLANLEKPVIAAINGHALGGGLELALACDIIIASENAKLGLPEINIGLMPGGGGTQRLPRRIGLAKAKELIFTGEIINASEAERIGLVNKVVPPDELSNVVNKMAQKLVAKSPLMLKLAKASINKSEEIGLSEGMAYELEVLSLCFSTLDQKEGIRAFFEKRPPVFKGDL